MTLAEELSSLEEINESGAAAGYPKMYRTPGGTMVERDWKMVLDRLDQLRSIIARQSSTGTCPVGQFRQPD